MQTTPVPRISPLTRISSIDIIRAITMVLMIFVNDLWSLKDIPLWLEHTKAEDDGMGLADVVFPAFLVIVGMSAPFSVAGRRARGEDNFAIVKHILIRSFALIVMGVFLVNGETINAAATGIPRWTWFPLCCLCFILIWNNYPRSMNKKLRLTLQVGASVILFLLAWFYRGGEEGNDRFSTSWWGILGLIGWAYFVSSLAYTFLGHNLWLMTGCWLLFIGINTAAHAHLLPAEGPINQLFSPFEEGAMPAFVTGGIICSMLLIRQKNDNNQFRFIWLLLVISAVLFVAGFAVRPLDGISKIKATPSWVLICTAVTFFTFILIYWLSDIRKKEYWFNIIKPAGTNTLTCYLLPYFAYGLMNAFAVSYPSVVSYGFIGLIKSFVFAMLIVMVGGWLGKKGVQVKL
ncbi:MAG TPA: DUF5009 domain-containing protein [Flavitalea sp.]|nr:DUF5009 domain-containing protein [Flavitalea sp.]